MDPSVENYEFLEVAVVVVNKTDYDLELVTANLEWGKFDEGHTPLSVPKKDKRSFTARGRSSSPSGTEGYVVWKLSQHPNIPEIKIYFSNPAVGKSEADISCHPSVVPVLALKKEMGCHGYEITYIIGNETE